MKICVKILSGHCFYWEENWVFDLSLGWFQPSLDFCSKISFWNDFWRLSVSWGMASPLTATLKSDIWSCYKYFMHTNVGIKQEMTWKVCFWREAPYFVSQREDGIPLTWTGQFLFTPLLMRVMVSLFTSWKVSINFHLLNISVPTWKQKNSSVFGVMNILIYEPCTYWSTPNCKDFVLLHSYWKSW